MPVMIHRWVHGGYYSMQQFLILNGEGSDLFFEMFKNLTPHRHSVEHVNFG
jgi:hypothetical protein